MARLVGLGVLFHLRDGRLEIDAPRDVLSDSDRAALKARKDDLLALVAKAEGWGADGTVADPDPLDALVGPRRTAWGTLVWSDPDAPPLKLFGPPPETGGPRS